MRSEIVKLSIILLNHNNSNLTIECLKSLEDQSYSDFEIIIVENNSNRDEKDNLFSYIKSLNQLYQEKIQVLRKTKNFGFAKGNDIGIENSSGEYILLLNNDTEFEPKFIHKCINFFKNDTIDIMSPKIMYFHNKDKIWDAGGFIKFLTPGLSCSRGAREIDKGQYDFITSPDYAAGCCFFIKRNVLTSIGMLDEDYFIYFEEADLCRRARNKGFEIIFYPYAKIYHKVNDILTDFHKFLLFRNKFIFLLKFFPLYKIIIQFVLQPLQIIAFAIDLKRKSISFRTIRKCFKFIFLGIRMGLLKRFGN